MIALTHEAVDVALVRASVSDPGFGAILIFEGTARNSFGGREVLQLEYESYEPLALKELGKIVDEIEQRWPGTRTSIVHRLGAVPLEDPTVVIATGAPHREACYAANRHALEALKERVPIWKKERYTDGHAWKANATSSG